MSAAPAIAARVALACAACVALPLEVDSAARGPVFRDVIGRSGIDFRFASGSRGRHDLVEIMGGGVAIFDADGDGRLDVYFCNGGPIGADGAADETPSRLYLNRGEWRFEDATANAGAPGPRYAMGVAVGDFDGDGRDDLFVTGWGDQRLYRNLGGGRFVDVTAGAGLASTLWSTSAAFADLDDDGDRDLFVATYVDYDARRAPACFAPDGRRDYCGPEVFRAQADRLYRNNGDGTFTDVSSAAEIDGQDGRGLGLVVADLVGDRRPDIFVANDGSASHLYENLGALKFREVGREAGVALDANGEALAGMGVAVGDVDSDGRADLLVTNFFGRSTIAFLAQEQGVFADRSDVLGLRDCTRGVLGFGIAVGDFDGDGAFDLIQANGHVLDRERLGEPFAMPPLVLTTTNGRFRDVSADAGDWARPRVRGRGVATGDLDGDGRVDIVLTSLDAAPMLLRNESRVAGLCVKLRASGPGGGDAVGAIVRARVMGRERVAWSTRGGSYLSASSEELGFGSDGAESFESVTVEWRTGEVERWNDLPTGGTVILEQGKGMRDSAAAGRRGRR